jgi:hypothetical protein
MSAYPDDDEQTDPTWRPTGLEVIELGSDHFATRAYAGGRMTRIMEWHRSKISNEWCVGAVPLRYPGETVDGVCWDVDSEEPLTLSPSLQCDCGVHGFIRSGRWVDV